METPKNYLVVIFLSDFDQTMMGRLQQHAPAIKLIMEMVSEKDMGPKLAFTSKTGETIGYFVRSKLPPWAIISQLNSPGTNDPRNPKYYGNDKITSPIQIKDRILVLELGGDFAHERFEGLVNWLKKNLQ